MHDLSGGHVVLRRIQEADELLMPVPAHVPAELLSGQHVRRDEQRGRAVAFVIMGHGPATALFRRPAGLRSVRRLNLRLFIHREHHCVRRRADVKPHNIVLFLDKSRIS